MKNTIRCLVSSKRNSGLSENKLRTVKKQFEKLGVQPATLRDTAGIDELKFVL